MPTGEPWTDDQIRLTIAAYLDMARKVESGRELDMPQAKSALAARLGREAGIPFALLNVSAALKYLGHPYLPQLDPKDRPGQRRLRELVAEHLDAHPMDLKLIQSLGRES